MNPTPALPEVGYRMHTSQLPRVRRTDSMGRLSIRGVTGDNRFWAGAVWRPPPGKRGAALHAALVERPCSCIRRLAGQRSKEIQFTRFFRNASVTTAEMAAQAGAGTAARVSGRDVVLIQDTTE